MIVASSSDIIDYTPRRIVRAAKGQGVEYKWGNVLFGLTVNGFLDIPFEEDGIRIDPLLILRRIKRRNNKDGTDRKFCYRTTENGYKFFCLK